MNLTEQIKLLSDFALSSEINFEYDEVIYRKDEIEKLLQDYISSHKENFDETIKINIKLFKKHVDMYDMYVHELIRRGKEEWKLLFLSASQ